MRQRPTIAELEAKANLEKVAEPEKDVERQEPKAEQENSKRASKPKKKRFKIRYFAGFMVLVAVAAAAFAYKTGKFDNIIKKYFGDDDNLDNNPVTTTVADNLPLDDNGIVSITYPIVDRTFEEDNGRYSLPAGFVPYYVSKTPQESELSGFKNSSSANVSDYESNVETKPTGYIGLDQEYAGFMSRIEDIKTKIAAGDSTYTSPLEQVGYEVSDLYKIANGYDLYTEDVSARDYAKLAYIDSDGSKVYMIPSLYVSKFIGVKTEIVELITKYEGLREQIIFAYNTYNNNSREFIGAINEEAENRGR